MNFNTKTIKSIRICYLKSSKSFENIICIFNELYFTEYINILDRHDIYFVSTSFFMSVSLDSISYILNNREPVILIRKIQIKFNR